MKKAPLITYLLIGIVHMAGHLLDWPEWSRYTKPMLMPALLFYVYVTASGHVTLKVLLLCLGIVFSFLGDLALMRETDLYFMLGIGAFLLAQLTYAGVYVVASFKKPELKLTPLLPILTYTMFFMVIIYPNLPGDMNIPVIIYGLAITVMASMARLRAGLTSEDSYQWVMMGSLLFVVSDSLIAFDKYYRSLRYDDEWIMGTYIVAQLLIAMGIMAHPDDK